MLHSSNNSVQSIQTLLWVSTATWWPTQHGWSIPTLGQVCLFYMSSLANKCTRSTPTGQIGSILYDKNHKVVLTFLFYMGKKMCKRSSHIASPPKDVHSIMRARTHTMVSSSWSRLNHFPKKQFCLFLHWWRVDGTSWQHVVFMPCRLHTSCTAALRHDGALLMHYTCLSAV